ncbi:MAG: V0D/AC39 family V-type ATPase subunit [Anaerolineae bacterium]
MLGLAAVSKYALVQAKVRALYADLLSHEIWESLIHAADLDAVLALLSDTIYGPYLEIDRSLLTPRRSVYQVRWHLADVYEGLIQVLRGAGRELLRQLWHHYEVDNVKAALRGVETAASWDYVLHLLYPMERFISVGTDRLERVVGADTVPEAVEILEGTPYYELLRHAVTRYEEEQSLFPLEMALDLGYRRELWACIEGLHQPDREMAMKTVGTALDTDNLLWAIRYRIYHHLSEEEIINYTLPLGYEVEDADIRAIARGDAIREVVVRVYPELDEVLPADEIVSGKELEKLEEAFLKILVTRCRHMFRGSPFHIGLPLAYVWLNEYEIRDLTVVVEAKASGVPAQVFTSRLLMPAL